MYTIRLLLMFTVMALATVGQEAGAAGGVESKAMDAPRLPFLDWKACPFEGCAYREWTARNSVTVYDSWKPERQQIAKLSAGDKVTGLTGLVITYKPGLIRMEKDLPEQKLKRGDTILTYAYRGEGFSAVWFNGRYYPEFDISFAKWPDGTGCGGEHCAAKCVDQGKKSWWAQIKLKDDRTGWVNMDHGCFDGVDMLGLFEFGPAIYDPPADEQG